MANVYWNQARKIEYPTPSPTEYPEPVPEWSPDPKRSALLVHDMQRYFLARFDEGGQPATDLVHNTARVIEAARKLGVPIVYTAQPGSMTPEQRGLLSDFWGPGMSVSPEHRAIEGDLAPGPEDLVIDKWRYSAFVRSPLREYLETKNRTQLVLCGIYAHVGVLATALDSYTQDIETFVLADATADFDRSQHLKALDYMARTCARVTHAEAVIKEWEYNGSL